MKQQTEDADWMEVMAAVDMAEKAANDSYRAIAGAVRAENPLCQHAVGSKGGSKHNRGVHSLNDSILRAISFHHTIESASEISLKANCFCQRKHSVVLGHT